MAVPRHSRLHCHRVLTPVPPVPCRDVIAASVDDRTPAERGLAPHAAGSAGYVIPKSRYGSVSTFIANRSGALSAAG